MISLMVVVVDEGFDLGFEMPPARSGFPARCGFQGLMPALDLALYFGVIGRTTAVLHAFVLQPFSHSVRLPEK